MVEVADVREFFEKNGDAMSQEELDLVLSIISRIEHTEPITQEAQSLSEELKLKGNALFKDADFRSAVELYTKSIEVNPSNYLVYSNRSLAYQKMGENEKAVKDCLEGIKLKPSFIKFYIRLAMIYSESDRAKAHEYCLKGLEYEPSNDSLRELAESTRPEINSATLGDMLKNKDLQSMVKDFVKDKSPDELSRMINDVLGKLKK